ncbi:MAG: eukaryotic-like serine/threonine-protein kinase [Gaiellaceae bacterium]|nr:eukaryotic-like serine/threonine-protein kinase [Gaiellaceae bacterium]
MPAPIDTLLPARYRDARPIAHGGMGEIFLATDSELGREVAVKVLAERYAKNDDLRARFKREALAAARLSGNHNIVTIFDVGEHGGRPIIVMEYLAGGSLEQRVKDRVPLEPAQVLDWLGEAAAALDAAHAAGIVHRDVKPGNLLLDDRGHVKVADFGIASAAGMDSFTQTGTILGTAGYLSPEQARGERATAASDRYALGVVAWELLTGRRPFESDTPTAEAVGHVNTPVPSAHAANPALPRGFDSVFEQALAKDPAARFSDASEFVGALRSALHDEAGDTGWIEPVAASAPTRVAATPGRSRLWIPVLVVALIAGGVLAAVLASRSSKHASGPGPRTVVRTVTGPGKTVLQTVTAPTTATTPSATTPSATTPSTTAPATPPSGGSGSQLNDAGFAKMRQGDYAGALPLLEQAVQKLSGSGSTNEAYADYNLAYTRRKLGRCDGVLGLLDRSQAIQGHRSEIDSLRADAQQNC